MCEDFFFHYYYKTSDQYTTIKLIYYNDKKFTKGSNSNVPTE